MLDPTVAAANRDYRAFGNMLFERKTDVHEVNNRIHSVELNPVIKKLTAYFAAFEKQISDEGKIEMVKSHNSATKKRI
jgi:hypothetical protein